MEAAVDDLNALPLEFLNLPISEQVTLDASQHDMNQYVFALNDEDHPKGKLSQTLNQWKKSQATFSNRARNDDEMHKARERIRDRLAQHRASPTEPDVQTCETAPVCFATHGSYGVVDLGATKTVIGSQKVGELINSLDPHVRKQVTRCECNITFRFGNHGTLKSEQALVVPLPNLLLKVAIVPGGTPFLISNTLLRAFQAVIDVEKHVMWSKKFNREYPLQLTPKGLFLVDLNDLAETSANATAARMPAETHLAEEAVPKGDVRQQSEVHPHEKMLSCPSSQTTGIASNNTPKQPDRHPHEHVIHEGQEVEQSGELAKTKGPETPDRPSVVVSQDPSALSSKTYRPSSQHAADAAVVDRTSAEDPSHSPGEFTRPSEAHRRGNGRHEGGFRDQAPWSPIRMFGTEIKAGSCGF